MDHINRRSIDICYNCFPCTRRYHFYNPCAFLQHVRQHFNSAGGRLDLSQVNIGPLPFGTAGLICDPKEFTVYDINDDEIVEDGKFNSRFYNPMLQDRGKRLVRFHPKDLLFLSSINNNLSIPLVLKQISKNIARCKFVTSNHVQTTTVPPLKPEVKPPLTCPECKKELTVTLISHLLGTNQPFDEKLECGVCKYIAPSSCSYQAHIRIHKKCGPFVCPDCGKCFEDWQFLQKHLNTVCYHMMKRVNFRCPVIKCRKLFTMHKIFRRHFFAHFLTVYRCKVCKTYYPTEAKQIHLKRHNGDESVLETKYECLACKKHYNFSDCPKHIDHHMPRREFYVYSYICKYCHSKFKSTSTYSVHMKRCPRRGADEQKRGEFRVDGLNFPRKLCFAVCGFCKTRKAVGFNVALQRTQCEDCDGKLAFLFAEEKITTKENRLEAIVMCLLCRVVIPQDDINTHAQKCQYAQSVVKMSVYDRCKVDKKSEETPKKKRKSSTPAPTETETPTIFDGVYRCKICEFAHTDRAQFHEHVISHRESGTSYQCMECGDCFVVKLSLIRHLMYFHKISNSNKYFKENECFDKTAAVAPVAVEEKLNENQCSVCKQQFSDETEFKIHFRIHGMAFLNSSVK